MKNTDVMYGLKKDELSQIVAVFKSFPAITSVVLYGSRAMGNYRPASDIDITLYTASHAPKNLLFQVMEALDNLELIYGFDVSLHQHIDSTSLLDHIRRVGVEIYNAQQARLVEQLNQEFDGEADDPAQVQSEAQMEENLILRLTQLGYASVSIRSGKEMKANLKRQLELQNKVTLTDDEFAQVINHLNKGAIFQRAETLRKRCHIHRDGQPDIYLQFLNTDFWCQNQYQVTSQVRQESGRANRYDVTLLVNGLPLVQIELKRRGVELKEAFNQINRYQRDSFWSEDGLFNYVQLFVISNGVNTKYFANNRKLDYKQTFFWADEDNTLITRLDKFADAFLEKCHVSKMISKYLVLHQSNKLLMIMRPYQVYAVENLMTKVRHFTPEKGDENNGYIWHTTGSGKTLTSFKAAQLICELGGKGYVDKVLFVVDRADLDYQTSKEFNHFSDGCVDSTDSTKELVSQLSGKNKLIVTTIQKLNVAVTKTKHEKALENLKGKRVVLIFDECHRSQFGESHANIKRFFGNHAQLFGFTGTPIKKGNHNNYRTTEQLFGEPLHKYLITNAINDENVLKFSVEYWSGLKDEYGNPIDESELRKSDWESDQRIARVTDWIIANHDRKTYNRSYSAMMCVGSKEALIKYYDSFEAKRQAGQHDLRIATIFSFADNEAEDDQSGDPGTPSFDVSDSSGKHKVSRDKLEQYVKDYNTRYKTAHSISDSVKFYTYYKDIAKRMKERERDDFEDKDRIDILLVVNMFLTGFDAKKLNTLYVDKNLKHHGLIQAFSRTNRTFGDQKAQGNIVCFRNLKANVDEAITMYCDSNAEDRVLLEPYDFYVNAFNDNVTRLLKLVATPDDVSKLISEDAQLAFVKAFRELMRDVNKLKSFTEFNWNDLALNAQTFADFAGSYKDLYDRHRQPKEGVPDELTTIDFELELIQHDEINVAYILRLLGEIKDAEATHGRSTETYARREEVMKLLGSEVQLRGKRHLIERFIDDYLPTLSAEQSVEQTFAAYWQQQKRFAIHELCQEEKLDKAAFYRLLDEYAFSAKPPLREQFLDALLYKPKLLERKKVFERLLAKFESLIDTYENHTGLIGISEPQPDYDDTSLETVSHSVGDRIIFFSDEVQRSTRSHRLVTFNLFLEQGYSKQLSTLKHYDLGHSLLAHGVVSDDILSQYLAITERLNQILEDYNLPVIKSVNDEKGLFWTLTEVREGSTVYEFLLQYWEATAVAGGGIGAFLASYPKISDGFKRLRDEIKNFCTKKQPEDVPSMIISENVEQAFKQAKAERDEHL
ncbi:type I restriction endonuclease subunit R, EcoR124 family [Salinimonas sediminis]|uniref:Type I restriction enzyme endonuclease subunit n=1 Tax=Salinimonas sediminis TaxID=2303538 RepID=A0A346NHB0_9ALTE|nr:HsdR family type I site-specific deoxyribonuclease [Salinimonas sediminis]AXR04917.1 HsdR family type I site-specific deoxyribonuclease [Salinimonas sediminis]